VPRTTRRTRRAVTERASALVLVPALALVLVVLGAIAVDLVAAHAAQRSLHRVVSAAADDAAGMVNTRSYQRDGILRVDPTAAERVVRARLRTADVPGRIVSTIVTVEDTTVDVRVRAMVPHVFLGALPGTADIGTVPIHVRGRLDR
jgi:hypothetical protein